MDVSRMTVVQGIYDRLARLEDDREVTRLADQDCTLIDSEMKALREQLTGILNAVEKNLYLFNTVPPTTEK